MKVLLTGSAGFIGSVLTSWLQEKGITVFGLDRVQESRSDYFFHCDLCNATVVDALCHQDIESFDCCIHLASQNGGFLHNAEIEQLPSIECRMLESVYRLCKNVGCERFIYMSSISVFEANGTFEEGPIVYDTQHTPYGKAKASGERLISSLFEHLTIIRPTNVFGQRQIELYRDQPRGYGHVIPELLNKIQGADCIEVFGDGTQERNFIHVSDVCAFIYGCLENTGMHWCNIRSDIQLSIRDLLEALFDHAGQVRSIRYRPEYMKHEPSPIIRFKNAQFAGTSLWNPQVLSVPEGLCS